MNADTQFRTKRISMTNNNAHDNGQIFKKSSLQAKFSVYLFSYGYELLYFLQEI